MKKTFLFVLLVLTLVVVVSCEPEAKHEHSWGEWTEKTAGTCTVKAKETRTCSTCEATEERDGNTDPDNHTLGESYTVKSQGTCSANEVRTYTCTACNATVDKDVENTKVENNHPEDKCAYKFESEPTFLTPAQGKEYCSACEKYTGEVGEYEYASVEGFWVSDEKTMEGANVTLYLSIDNNSSYVMDMVDEVEESLVASEWKGSYEWKIDENKTRTDIVFDAMQDNGFSVTEENGKLIIEIQEGLSFTFERKSEEKHEHTFDTEKASPSDSYGHNVPTVCESELHPEFIAYQEHDVKDGKCTICQYEETSGSEEAGK